MGRMNRKQQSGRFKLKYISTYIKCKQNTLRKKLCFVYPVNSVQIIPTLKSDLNAREMAKMLQFHAPYVKEETDFPLKSLPGDYSIPIFGFHY